ncbi:hypothetical protein [Xanthomonas phage X1]|nr:hypothetical protein [Xanthomonas phage X1]
MNIFMGSWSDREDMIADFCHYDGEGRERVKNYLDDAQIILAYYESSGYEGDAFVLFRKWGKYYEVSGGHCSCYGLEGQFEPEETTLEAIVHRLEHGDLGREYSWNKSEKGANKFADELEEAIMRLEKI